MHTMNYVQARWVLASESKPRRARQTQRGEKWHKDRDKMSIGGWRLSQGGVKHSREGRWDRRVWSPPVTKPFTGL